MAESAPAVTIEARDGQDRHLWTKTFHVDDEFDDESDGWSSFRIKEITS